MKLKFVLVPFVVLGFTIGSYADCSKDEILKLLDKGYSKSEVDGVCGKSKEKKGLEWINPSSKTCIAYGGKMYKGTCKAKWSKAKDICSASNARLPTVYELKKVIVDCGGIVDNSDSNTANISYQSCYKNKGFTGGDYWSSTTDVSSSSHDWGVLFYNGNDYWFTKKSVATIRCVRDGQ